MHIVVTLSAAHAMPWLPLTGIVDVAREYQ